ncbi:hypothetical protein WH52_01335 [Tenacibaculum holothuriorum]|uniref:Uncharacterized protein n=1 Tax=Tenacibaculum holothuriorum TaxID=1635173 RepID=A0A1Y2PGM1_9FLAO|nr:hypothetical protein [Tenacibaculum holothuriorum]OSY89310.1 hypothetical protein WH52_01335 [Tenacibaculum holothuriorum]
MKKLLLPVYKKDNHPRASHPYYILFNIGQTLEFTSKRKAEDYARLISSYIVDTIRMLNTIQKELYGIYLDNYFRLSGWWSVRIRPKLDCYLEDIEYFDKEYGRGNACIKFISFYRILNSVEDACKILRRAIKSIKDYNTLGKLNSFLQLLKNVYKHVDKLKKGRGDVQYKENTMKVVHIKTKSKKASDSMT